MRWFARLDRAWARGVGKRRLDSNLGNLGMLIGLMLPCLSIILNGPVPNSALAGMSDTLQILMCACIFGGCGLKLFGAMAGRRRFFPHMRLWKCYRLGISGALFAAPASWVYGYYIFMNTDNAWSAIAAISTPMFGLGILLQGVLYWFEARRIERNFDGLVTTAQAPFGVLAP